jgi:hypothetical protein
MSPPRLAAPVHCVHCQQLIARWQPRSGNSNSAIFWTDGEVTGPMVPHNYDLVICPYCDGLFWGKEAIVNAYYAHEIYFDDLDPFADEPNMPLPHPYAKPSGRTPPFLNSKPLSESVWLRAAAELKHEYYSREIAWQFANHPSRASDISVEYSDIQQISMNKLLLYWQKQETEVLRRIEIWRNLGNFKRAASLLEFIPENRTLQGNFLLQLVKQEERHVKPIPKSRNEFTIYL